MEVQLDNSSGSNGMIPVKERSKHSFMLKLYVGLVLFFGFIYVVYYMINNADIDNTPTQIDYVNPEDANTSFEEVELYNQGRALLDERNFEEAAEVFDDIARETNNTYEAGRAVQQAGLARFFTADTEKQKEGIAQIKSTILVSDSIPRLKATGILNLGSLVCGSGCDKDLFEIVFQDEPFSRFRAGDNIARSVANLYEWGLTIYPTQDLYVRVMSYYGDLLLARGKEMSDTEIEYFSSLIDKYKEEADRLLAREIQNDQVSERGHVAYYFWKGYAYGGLAYVNPDKYSVEFENAYKKSIEIGEAAKSGSNSSHVTAFAYYQYAALLHRIYGETHREQVQGLLDSLSANVRANGPAEINQFVLMVGNEVFNEEIQHGFIGESIYELAKQYPSFKSFLKEYGVDVDEKVGTENNAEQQEIGEE